MDLDTIKSMTNMELVALQHELRQYSCDKPHLNAVMEELGRRQGVTGGQSCRQEDEQKMASLPHSGKIQRNTGRLTNTGGGTRLMRNRGSYDG